MTVFSNTFDTNAPGGGDDPAEADNNMRRIQAAIQERENVDHYWPLTGTQVSDADSGEHRKVTLRVASAPTAVANKGFVYAKDVGGKAELFYIDEDGNEVQITSGGILNSLNLAGAQSAAGVKTFTSIPVLPASDPTAANEATRKTYVDNRTTMVPAISGAGAGYAGEESITGSSGFIMKQGSDSVPVVATKAVTFAVAFPTAVLRVFVQQTGNVDASALGPLTVYNQSVGGFTVRNNNGLFTRNFDWFAIGY